MGFDGGQADQLTNETRKIPAPSHKGPTALLSAMLQPKTSLTARSGGGAGRWNQRPRPSEAPTSWSGTPSRLRSCTCAWVEYFAWAGMRTGRPATRLQGALAFRQEANGCATTSVRRRQHWPVWNLGRGRHLKKVRPGAAGHSHGGLSAGRAAPGRILGGRFGAARSRPAH